jgi:RimJ/RimL family protein N-acetyltransferase
VLLLLLGRLLSEYFILVHHPFKPDDRHLLAHAMASDFRVAWQYYAKPTLINFTFMASVLSNIQGQE